MSNTRQPRPAGHSDALQANIERVIASYESAFGPDAIRPGLITAEQLAAASPEARQAWGYLLLLMESAPEAKVERLEAEVERGRRDRDSLRDDLDEANRDRQWLIDGKRSLRAERDRMRPVYDASLAMRRSESRVALTSDVIAEIEAERSLTDAQVEERTQAALTRWRITVDTVIAASKESTNG